MGIIWKVKDGGGEDVTDQGTELDIEELTTKLEKHAVLYLSESPPSFNSDSPSEYYRHIVIQITDDDKLNNLFNKVGFYVVKDAEPSQAAFLFA